MTSRMLKKIYNEIKKNDKIVIARHVGADPDALGSSLGLKELILNTFPNKEVYAVGTTVSRFKQFGKVDKVSNYTKQQYEGETPVTYSKSLEVTLHEEKKEPVTVIINNSVENPVAGKIYEFEFMIDNKKELKDNIESIFKNCLVVEIRETTKTGLAQRQDEIK